MRFSARLSSRTLNTQLAVMALLFAAFFLLLAMLYRSFVQYNVAIASIDDPVGTAGLMQMLERYDADYRVRKDGSVIVARRDAERLAAEGLSVPEARAESQWGMRTLLLFLMAVVVTFIVVLGKKYLYAFEQRRPDGETPDTYPESSFEEASAVQPVKNVLLEHARTRFTSRLFEGEHPQTLAVYLLGLDTDEAASSLETMVLEQRNRVWERMLFSGKCDDALRSRVAALYAGKLKRIETQMRSPETTEKLVAIYRRLPSEIREALLATLRRGEADRLTVTLFETEERLRHAAKEA